MFGLPKMYRLLTGRDAHKYSGIYVDWHLEGDVRDLFPRCRHNIPLEGLRKAMKTLLY